MNNGQVKFQLKNTNTGHMWDFSNRTNGFNITRRGTGGAELVIKPDGELHVGPGSQTHLIIRANGDGELRNGTWAHTSSRSSKEAIEAVEGEVVLDKLARLEVATWQYKDRGERPARHMGPMAEDFYRQFQLGANNRTVSSADLAGVAMAGVKALREKVQSQRGRIEELEAEVAELRQLKERVAAIASRLPERVALHD